MSANDPIPTGTLITGRVLNKAIKGGRTAVIGGAGVAVQSNRREVVITPRERKPQRFVQWLGRVVWSVRDGSNWRWIYVVREIIKSTPGYGGWIDRPNGREVTWYNWDEDANSAFGVQGHGVNVDNLPGDFETQPIPNGWPVLVTDVTIQDGTGKKEHWGTRANGIDGTCPP